MRLAELSREFVTLRLSFGLVLELEKSRSRTGSP
jgi:hypothetical protein